MRPIRILALSAATLALLAACATPSGSGPMSFFITSAGSGKGADLGGLAGADAIARSWPARPVPAARPGVPT